VKHHNFDLMHIIFFFSQPVCDEFIVKREEYVNKIGRTLANRVVERRNMINVYLKGRACIESVRRSLILRFSLVYRFSCHLLILRVFPLLNNIFELLFGLRFSSCVSCSIGFKIQTLYFLL
jgi:hypothetical protein